MLYTDDWYYLTMAIDINKSQLLLSWLWYNLPKCLNIIFVFMDSRTGISPLRIALNTLLTSYSVSSGWKWYLLHTPLGCFLGPLLLWQSAHFWKLPRESTHSLRFNYVPWFGRFLLARPLHCKFWFIIDDLQLSGRHLTLANSYTCTLLIIRSEVDVSCVLFWTQPACMVQNQNTRNIYLWADDKQCMLV